MSRCQRKVVPGVTSSRIPASPPAGTVPGSSASHARSGHVNRVRAFGRSRSATASWWRRFKISASFHHDSRRDSLSSDVTRDMTRKISFKPTSRRSATSGRAKTGPADAERLTEPPAFP
jgi:hypothetical protein